MSKANLRNLSAGEIVEQVLQARRLLAKEVQGAGAMQDVVDDDDDGDAGELVAVVVVLVLVVVVMHDDDDA